MQNFDARDSVVSRVKIGLDNDVFSGYIPIPEDIPEGDYTVRAYTNTMRNIVDEDYFFTKSIRIGVPMSRKIQAFPEFEFAPNQKINADIRFSSLRSVSAVELSPFSPALVSERSRTTPISPESLKISVNNGKPMNVKCENGVSGISFNLPPTEKHRVMLLDATCEQYPFQQYIRIPLPDDDFDVSFYPEGGNALNGSMGRVAFKAMQRDGTEIDVSGVVYDGKGNEITNFKTDARGMGQLMLMPEKGEAYHAVCTNKKGQSKRFDLPVAQENGYALTATWLNDSLMVAVRRSESVKTDDILCLIVHTRGMVQDVSILENQCDSVIFHKDFFPSGVTHLLLLDKNMVPVSERLVFVDNDNHAKVKIETDRESYSTQSPVACAINLIDKSGEPLQGNISISVTGDHEVSVDTTFNILTSLLLSSDLRGNIVNPAFYFQKNDQSDFALDLLMLTQGWRRYDTERIIRNDIVRPNNLQELGYEISGTVKRQFLRRTIPEENANVSMVSLDGKFFDVTATDRKGRFTFQMDQAPDSTWFIVKAIPQKGKNNLHLTLDRVQYPARTIPAVASELPQRDIFAKYAEKAEQQYVEEHGNRTVNLSEVTITAQKKPVRKSDYYRFPDHSITEEELDKLPPLSLNELLRRFPGVVVNDTGVYLSRNLMSGSKQVMWLIDGVPQETTVALLADHIAQVDILTSSINTAMFGDRGRGGVIAIYTREGKPRQQMGNNPTTTRRTSFFQGSDGIYRKTPDIKNIMPLGFQKPAEFYAPKYDTPAQNTKPDLRTTIHWQPSLTTDEAGTASFNFYTANTPGTYTVVIEGVTDCGKIVYKRDKILVRWNL